MQIFMALYVVIKLKTAKLFRERYGQKALLNLHDKKCMEARCKELEPKKGRKPT